MLRVLSVRWLELSVAELLNPLSEKLFKGCPKKDVFDWASSLAGHQVESERFKGGTK